MKTEKKATAYDIKIALSREAQRRGNKFFEECKNGSTYFPGRDGLLILDGVEIKPSWSHFEITGYEIKISRSDFLRDNKANLYKQYCNKFFFVVPTGIISKTELPEDTGLIYFNPDNGTLKTVQRAEWRQIDIPTDMLMYIIFTRVDSDRNPIAESHRTDYARAYLEDKAEKRDIGSRLGSKMARELEQLRTKDEGRISRPVYQKLIDDVEKEIDAKYGYWNYRDISEEDAERALKEIKKALANNIQLDSMKFDIEYMCRSADSLAKQFEEITGEKIEK